MQFLVFYRGIIVVAFALLVISFPFITLVFFLSNVIFNPVIVLFFYGVLVQFI